MKMERTPIVLFLDLFFRALRLRSKSNSSKALRDFKLGIFSTCNLQNGEIGVANFVYIRMTDGSLRYFVNDSYVADLYETNQTIDFRHIVNPALGYITRSTTEYKVRQDLVAPPGL